MTLSRRGRTTEIAKGRMTRWSGRRVRQLREFERDAIGGDYRRRMRVDYPVIRRA